MSKSNTFENDLLKLIFNATPITGIADNAVGGLTNLYVALHTADPGEAGLQSTSEITYTGYSRMAVSRNSTGFTVANDVVSLTASLDFPVGTGGGGTASHFSIGTAASGAGKVLYKGPITPGIATGTNITPRLSATTNISED